MLSDDQGGQAEGGKGNSSFTPKGMTKREQRGQIILLQRELDYRPDHDVVSIAGRADSHLPGGCLVYGSPISVTVGNPDSAIG